MTDWQSIVEKHGKLVWQIAYRLLNNDADAADCFQETFVSAFGFSQRRRVRNFRALLARLATIRAIDLLRKRIRNTQLQLNTDVPDTNAGPSQQAQGHELANRLRKALVQLPSSQAQIFCLRHLNDFSYRQIAKELGIKINTVGVELHRARLKLRRLLQDAGVNEKNEVSS